MNITSQGIVVAVPLQGDAGGHATLAASPHSGTGEVAAQQESASGLSALSRHGNSCIPAHSGTLPLSSSYTIFSSQPPSPFSPVETSREDLGVDDSSPNPDNVVKVSIRSARWIFPFFQRHELDITDKDVCPHIDESQREEAASVERVLNTGPASGTSRNNFITALSPRKTSYVCRAPQVGRAASSPSLWKATLTTSKECYGPKLGCEAREYASKSSSYADRRCSLCFQDGASLANTQHTQKGRSAFFCPPFTGLPLRGLAAFTQCTLVVAYSFYSGKLPPLPDLWSQTLAAVYLLAIFICSVIFRGHPLLDEERTRRTPVILPPVPGTWREIVCAYRDLECFRRTGTASPADSTSTLPSEVLRASNGNSHQLRVLTASREREKNAPEPSSGTATADFCSPCSHGQMAEAFTPLPPAEKPVILLRELNTSSARALPPVFCHIGAHAGTIHSKVVSVKGELDGKIPVACRSPPFKGAPLQHCHVCYATTNVTPSQPIFASAATSTQRSFFNYYEGEHSARCAVTKNSGPLPLLESLSLLVLPAVTLHALSVYCVALPFGLANSVLGILTPTLSFLACLVVTVTTRLSFPLARAWIPMLSGCAYLIVAVILGNVSQMTTFSGHLSGQQFRKQNSTTSHSSTTLSGNIILAKTTRNSAEDQKKQLPFSWEFICPALAFLTMPPAASWAVLAAFSTLGQFCVIIPFWLLFKG